MYCLLTIFARRRGVWPSRKHSSRRRAGARPPRIRAFMPRELRQRQVHSTLDALNSYCRVTATPCSAQMKVGRDRHGFRNWTAPNPIREWLYLSHNWPSYQGGSLHTSKDYLRGSHPRQVIPQRNSQTTWHSVKDSIRQRNKFTSKFWLSLQQTLGTKHRLPPPVRWTDIKSQ
jgi:hypothetical protein